MSDFALLALPGAYHSSAGALTDSFLLAKDRVEHMFADELGMRMETALRVLSPDGGPVLLSDDTILRVEGAIDETPYAFIWLPAIRVGGSAALEKRLALSQPLLGWLRRQSAQGAIIGASGASAMLLMAAGLTDGVAVPVARALRPLVRAFFPRQRLEERRSMIDTGALLIANGIAGDLALVVRVMERTISPAVARWLTSIMGLDGAEADLLATDPLVARAQLWLEQRFTGSISMTALADHLSTSQATLNRRFHKALGVSPNAYFQQLRLDAAMTMLNRTDRSVDQIAQMVGYSDSRLFRTMFRRHTGLTATQWRAGARSGKVPLPTDQRN